MKNNIFRTLLTLAFAALTLPMLSQDFMNVYFKDGTFRTFHFNTIKEISVSKIDADGSWYSDYQFQHIVTKNEEFVYDLALIDSISFTKYQEHVVRNNTKEALTTALPLLSKCFSAREAEEEIETIKGSEGVETAWVEGDFLFIKIKEGETISFHFSPEDAEPISNGINVQAARILQTLPKTIKKLKDENGRSLKAVVANQQHFVDTDWRMKQRSNFMYPLRDKLEEAGYEKVDIYDDIYIDKPDLNFFYDTMYDNDVVFLSTHGGCWTNGGHILLTGESFGMVEVGTENNNWPTTAEQGVFSTEYEKLFEDPRFKDSEDDMTLNYEKEYRVINGEGNYYWVSYVIIKESFFSNTVKKSFTNPKSIFFNAACQSLMGGDELANIFREQRGLGTYVGYTQSNFYGQEAGCTMLTEMLNGISAEKAYSDLGDHTIELIDNWKNVTGTYKDEDIIKYKYNKETERFEETERYTASVSVLPNNSDCFITPVYTNEIDSKIASNEYKNSKSVEVEGLTTIIDCDDSDVLNAISYGFEYGQKYGQTWTRVTSKDKMPSTKNIDKGNVLFKAKLTNIELGKEYYYRAYTNDGLNYNYGDLCSFTLYHNLQVPVQELELEEGEKVSFTIAAGSGEYTAKSDQENYAKASVNGNEVFIEAISEGDAVITITDMKTEQTAEVAVKVINKPTPDIILSTQEVYMEVGETQQIEVTSGSGSYSVWVYAPDVADVTVYGNIITIKALSAGKTIARVIDDITGKEKPFGIEVKETTSETDSQELMLSKQVNGVDYKIYKKILDPSDYHINPDGWKCYRSELILETTSNGSTKTTVMDDHIYLDDSRGHHGGQTPCMLLDFIENQIIIFCNSKDAGNNYTMEGYAYISPITNLRFSKETVFTKANWGWYPFFSLSGNSVQLNYFSYAGYYAMIAERNGNGSWNNQRVGSIKPDAFEAMSKENGPVTVIENAELPTPDENLPAEAVDLGLPSGTLWASYNVGAKRPEDFGGFYAWGETFEKTDYSQTDYTMYGKYTRSDGLTELEPEDDVATVLWGAPWHMPTKAQMQELINNCTWTWITINGTNGFRVTGSNGNSIFLPAAGTKADGSHNIANQRLTYWSNAVNTSNTNQAGMIWSWENPPAEYDTVSRWFGYSVRAVRDKEEVDERIEDVIPGEYRDIIDDYIPIYDGINPPNVEGVYYIDPEILTASSLSNDQIGKKYNSEYLKLSEQDMTKNTVKMIRVQGGGSEWAKGDGAFISGSGNNFTIFFNSKGKSSGVDYVMAYVISGTKTANGIKNYTSGFILKEKGADPDDKMVKVGTFRFFKDQDGMSENAEWPYGNTYDARKRNATGNRLPNSLDAE